MFRTTETPHAKNEQTIVVCALSSITTDQARTITGIVQASRQLCDVQTIDDYDGYLSILIEPSTVGEGQRAFFISGTAQCLELAETQDDCLMPIGTFADIEALGAQLTNILHIP